MHGLNVYFAVFGGQVPKVKKIKYSNKLIKELCDLIVAEQRLVSPICRAYKQFPSARTVYRWQSEHPEAHDLITSAYTMLMEDLQEEFNLITKTDWVMKNIEAFGGSERAAFEARRARMDFIKTTLTQIAPVLTPRFQKSQVLEHKGTVETGPQIQILNYHAPAQPALEQTAHRIDVSD